MQRLLRRGLHCASAWHSATKAVTGVRDGQIFRITMNRPERYNAWNEDVFHAFLKAIRTASADDSKVAVITGAGPYFTSGNDMANFAKKEMTPESTKQFAKNLQDLVGEIIDFKKPLVAAVNGPGIGIGVTLLGLCDFVYVSDKAWFLAPFTSVGLCAEACSSYTIPAIVGPLRANELLLMGKKWTAQQAFQYGLANEIFEDAIFAQSVEQRLQELVALPTNSLQFGLRQHSLMSSLRAYVCSSLGAGKAIIKAETRPILHRINALECAGIQQQVLSEDCKAAVAKFNSRKK